MYPVTQMGPALQCLVILPPKSKRRKAIVAGFVEVYRGPERSYKVTKLQPGVRYTSRVQAVNPLGEGPFSLCSAYTTQATVPAAPEPPVVQAAASNALTLQWTPPPDNGSPIIGYRLERDDGPGTEFRHCYVGPNTWHTVTKLSPGTVYRFRLRADNDEGQSTWSPTASLLTGAAPPDSPAALQVVTPLTTSATLAWSPPEKDYGSKVVAYEVELQAISRAAVACMGTAWLKIFEGEALACTINSLCPGCAYFVRVRARNSAGWGDWATPVNLTTAPDVPEAPLSLQPTSCSESTIVISWAPPRHDGGSKGSPTALPRPVLCKAQSPLVVYNREHVGAELRNLQPGCRYIFRLQAVPNFGPPGPAGIITDQRLIVGLSFKPCYRGPDTSCEVRGLEPKSTYALRLRAHNDVGPSEWSACAAAITSHAPPTCPVSVVAQPASCCKILLCWMPPEKDNGAAVFSYTGGSNSTSWSQLYLGEACACSADGLAPARTYQFRVRASNVCGCGPSSAVVTATTLAAPPSAPGKPVVLSRAATNIRVRWDEPEHSYGAVVTTYKLEGAPAGTDEWTTLYEGSEATGDYSECEAITTAMMAPMPPTNVLVSSDSTEDAAASGPAETAFPSDGARAETIPIVTVTWQDPPAVSPHAAAMGYEVEARPKPGSDVAGASGGGVVKVTVASRRCDTRLEGLVPGCTYAVRVRSVGVEGTGHSSWSEEACVAIQPRLDVDTASVCSASAAGGGAAGGNSIAPRKGGAASKRARRQQTLSATAPPAHSTAPAGPMAAASARAPSTSGDEAVAPTATRARSKPPTGVLGKRGTATTSVALPRPRPKSWLVRLGECSSITENLFSCIFGPNWRRDAGKQLQACVNYAIIIAAVVIFLVFIHWHVSSRH
ncbi:hypothetical protein VOLCADRAFT_119739 [Volvox carteri f. nagariensis]|uniref:Fibronectin type-III domain-containing protein n=1 Tax=Volvox carteri f. nagariensis TaxID=3068 RepID=D8UG77_VOLCA|nr:uncharacterized protein VOLCADRAFT_119739 [Volvox carteri f. nagariensis]EFJ41212.1 hypothetical protein VOLCADRAFT_119739 [Volvox carteri f. nagariensis]|eukprot:XP_002957663.1 hypothetical protein VOLCADRAFT_119739 [Volvox carteri f. nagariensis]